MPMNKELEVTSAIQAFEQILEVMPGDMSSLESLWRAYSDQEQEEKALDYLLRLGEAIVEHDDKDTADRVLADLRGAAYQDERVKSLENDLARVAGAGEEQEPAEVPQLRHQVNMADELSFAWYLFQSEQLTKEEYSRIADVLAEMSATGREGTVSVLHALEAEQCPRMASLLAFCVKKFNLPYVNVTAFDIGLETSRIFPFKFILGRGVMPFELINRKHLLIALLNPHDGELRREIESALTGYVCHFYLTSAMDFDDGLKALSERLSAAIGG